MEESNIKFRLFKQIPVIESPTIDTAKLLLCNGFSASEVQLFGQVDECADCSLLNMTEEPIEPGANDTAFALSSIFAYRLELRLQQQQPSAPEPESASKNWSQKSCGFHVRLDEFGEYVLNVGQHHNCGGVSSSHETAFCELRQVKAGQSSMLPLIVLFAAALIGFPLIFLLARLLLRALALWRPAVYANICSAASFLANPHATSSAPAGEAHVRGQPSERPRSRVLSVDTLRGAAIAIMILNTYGVGSYECLDHVIWNGLHLSDLAFPTFVFVMGISIAITNRRDARRIKQLVYPPQLAPVSTQNHVKRGVFVLEFAKLIYRFSWRSLLLFGIGISLMNVGFDDYSKLRICGVLQRLSLTYLLTSIATLPVLLKYATHTAATSNGLFWDLTRFWPEWIPILTLVALQTGLEFGIDPANWNDTSVVSMTGCPRGYLGPGGLHWNGSYQNCTGGAHRLIDLYILGEKRMNTEPFTKIVYETNIPFEWVGLLGTCCSVFLCFLGVQAGKVLLFSRTDRERAVRWAVWASCLGLFTLPLVLISSPYPFNSSLLPINWSLCTASFALAMAAIDTAFLGLLYFLVDFRKKQSANEPKEQLGEREATATSLSQMCRPQWPHWSGAPLTFLGANPILLYVAHQMFQNFLPLTLLHFVPDTHWGYLTYSLWAVAFWTLVAYVLYRKKLFLSI